MVHAIRVATRRATYAVLRGAASVRTVGYMVKWMLLVTMLAGGCSMYFGTGDEADGAPDAAVIAEPDAPECEPQLPSCFSLGCAVGALTPNCPVAEDTSVCYCPAAKNAGWCLR